jgi:Rrf2 family protein
VPINWRTDYAIRLTYELARLGPGSRETVRRLAETSSVPYDYARTIVHQLTGAGVLKSRRGVGGGVELARSADEISLLDVFYAMEEPATLARCTLHGDACSRSGICPLHRSIWLDIDNAIAEKLGAISLATAVATAG